jgi:hypothetical protein
MEEIVYYDYELGKKAALDSWAYQDLQVIQKEQEEWTKQCRAKLESIDKQLKQIEKDNGYA